MTLGEINIGEEEIIETYKNGPEICANYEFVMQKFEEGLTPTEIHREYGFPLRQLYKYRDNSSKPHALHAIDEIDSILGLPINLYHEKFRQINLLTSATYWRGSIPSIKSKPTSGKAVIGIKNETQQRVISQLADNVGFSWVEKDHITRNSPQKYISLNGKLGRIIEVLGFTKGAKMENELIVPKYIEAALESINSPDVSENEKYIATNVLEDFILTLLFFRLRKLNKQSVASLITFDNEETSEIHGKIISDIANCLKIPSLATRHKVYKNSIGNFMPILILNPQTNLEQIFETLQSRVMDLIQSVD